MFKTGLNIILSIPKMRKNPKGDPETYDIYISLALMLLVYPCCLLFAYIWHQFQ